MNITVKINSCRVCNSIRNGREVDLFTDFQANAYLKRIYDGLVTTHRLDYDVYQTVARKLTDGVSEGFGKSINQTVFGTPDYKMLESMRENVYVFSAAKSYQSTKDISALLYEGGELKPLKQFLNEAKPLFDTYNKTYLTAEYNSAVMQARSASDWKEFESDAAVYEQLEYHTVGDRRVRPEHMVLDRTVKPVHDKFWDVYYPPNGWNCRCTVLQVSGEKNTTKKEILERIKEENVERRKEGLKPMDKNLDVPKIFQFNAGKSKIIFSPDHPYFDVAKKDKAFAKTNFGLPLPR